ncbi:hypothetical protein CDL12_06839 [Handroanthus impetiginosus]|uniref:Transcriptional coactivator Hfi1/Transcriptional adapter 1 n=1 Tax=Handroanthus impetiginosus TaxID=429701 RepID=A0A2G9HSP6_9LAMI|nr:hypothetical protein CDL12_06839 [Handroanthus impetiginosus]
MVANHHFTRIDTLELKDLIYQRIGHERAEKYFDQLRDFLASKLSKSDFDKNCIQMIGRENISLHNRLIRSIIHNACQAKIPPQKPRKVGELGVKVANGYQRNCLQSLYSDAFPQSPRKCRSPVYRDRKFRDRPSPLGPLGKSPSITCEETVSRMQEQSTAEMRSFSSRPPMGVAIVEDGEEVEQFAEVPSIPMWSGVTAPVGVSFNTGGARKPLQSCFSSSGFVETCQSSGELPDTKTLRSRLDKTLASEGVGISMEAANVLNNSLNAYLKRAIKGAIGNAAARRAKSSEQMTLGCNGILPGRYAERPTTNMNLLDFCVAMESNPSILGPDWPTQLEKICNYALR